MMNNSFHIKSSYVGRPVFLSLGVVFTLLFSAAAFAETLPVYGDEGGRHFSPLTQITPANVRGLEKVWEYRGGEFDDLPDEHINLIDFQVTPLKLPEAAGGSLVFCSGMQNIVSIDPETGKREWIHKTGVEISPLRLLNLCRGLAYWQEPSSSAKPADSSAFPHSNVATCRHRVFMATADRHLISLDATNGKLCKNFGDNGVIDMRDESDLFPREDVTHTSPPIVVNQTIVVGSSVQDFSKSVVPSGVVKGFDVLSGKELWRYNPIPTVGDGKNWPKGINPRAVSGAANVWSPISADAERDLVFLPTSSAQPDFYGVERAGDNRDANSLVVLKASTGERVWGFQFIHHDIWDYDVGPQPIVAKIQVEGKSIPAVIQMTKQGYTFVFNRETGEPVWPIDEIPVSQDGLPGQYLSPTQPRPRLPEPMMPHTLNPEDAWGFTPIDRAMCRRIIEGLRRQGPFTPPTEEWTLQMPGLGGGANWGGGAVDEARGILIVNINTVPMRVRLHKRGYEKAVGVNTVDGLDMEFGLGGTPYDFQASPLMSPLGVPCSPTPWGELAAMDLGTGKWLWRVPLGSVHDMGPFPVPFEINLGTPTFGGGILTDSGVYFIGSTMDRSFRAFDASNGEQLWRVSLPADAMATPMTYEHNGRQYVVIASGGHHMSADRPKNDVLIAYALPK